MRYPTLKITKPSRTVRESIKLKRLERARKVLAEATADAEDTTPAE